ncbi:MAG: chemotaxis protein CheW [Acidobacteria bacterium]|nr:chemotaxis protein CheW [Acidobacteriota bacterium]
MPEHVETDKHNTTRQYATFSVDGLFFGVEVLKVQEVLRFQAMTPVPRAARVIEGLINLRGAIVTAFDMRHRLGLDDRADGQMPMNMVLRHDDGAVSLLVDEIGDVIEVSKDDFEPPPETIPETAREMLEGVYKLPNRLLLVLSTEKVLQT